MIKRQDILVFLFVCTIIFSIFSQIDFLDYVARPMMYVLWTILIGFSIFDIFDRKLKIHLSQSTKVYIVIYFLFVLYCMTCGLFNNAYLEAKYLRVLFIPLIIVLFIDICPDNVSKNYVLYAKVFVVASVIFALTVQRTYMSSYSSWLSANSYVYDQKNSAAQIWICAVLLCWFVIKPKNRIEKMLWHIVSAYLLILSGLSQCRTAILALFVGITTVILFRSKHKFRWALLFGILLAFLFINPKTYQYLNQALLIERYAGTDLNTMSSGRIASYERTLAVIKQSPIFGVGSWYVDCSYISILAESGIIGFLLIETIWIKKLHSTLSFSFFGEGTSLEKHFFIAITAFYVVESVLEGFPPFGPGVSALGFWLFTGLMTRYYKQIAEEPTEGLEIYE